MDNWLPASTVKGLFPATVSAPASVSGIGSASSSIGIGSHAGADYAAAGRSGVGGQGAATATMASSVTPQIYSTDPTGADTNTPGGGYSAAQASQLARDASQQAVGAFKQLMSDPIGRIGTAYEQLGPSRAMIVGGVFLGVFVVLFVLAAVIGKIAAIPGMTALMAYDTKTFFKMLIVLLFYLAALLGVITAFRTLLKTGAHFAADLFTVGASLIPVSVVVFLASILDRSNRAVASILDAMFVVAIVTGLLIAFNSLVQNGRMRPGLAGLTLAIALMSAGLVRDLIVWLMI